VLSPRRRKVLRDVWLHKSRTTLVVLAIAIGIIGAGSVLDTWALLRRVTREEYRASNPPSATLRTDSIDAALLERVRAINAVGYAEARRTVVGSVQTPEGWRTLLLFTAEDLTAIRIGVVKPDAERWPPQDGELAIERSSVDFAGLGAGDAPAVQIGDAPSRALRISGVARDVGLAPGWMEHVVYGFVTRRTLEQLGAASSLNELRIVVRDRALEREAVRRVALEAKAVIERSGRHVSDVDVPVPMRHIHAGQIESLLFTQGAFGVLALLLSGILVVNLVAAMLAGQVREIGIMKTLGARAAQVARMYLGVALVLGLVASVVAVPAGAVIGRLYAQFTADLLNFDLTGATIPPSIFGLQLAVGLLLPVVAAGIPIVRGCRISVSEALRDTGIVGGSASGGTLLNRVGGLTRPLLLALRNAFRRRQRMVLTLATLAMGGAVYLGSINLRASIVGSVDLMFGAQRFDIVLQLSRAHAPDSIASVVANVAGVARAEAWSGARAALSRGDGMLGNAFPITAPPAGSAMLVPAAIERGRWLQSGDTNVLVVNRRLLADEPTLEVGNDVSLVVAGRMSRWRVIGVVESGPSAAAYAPRETVAGPSGDGRVSTVVVESTLRGPASQLELVQRLRAELGERGMAVRSSQLMQEQRRVIEDHLLMVAGFLGVMSQLMIVVGGLGLASTMSLTVLERTREIGVLRAIGARHRAILTMIQVEGLVIAGASWIVALPLSVPMSVVLARAFGRIMIRVPVTYVPEPSGVLRWLVVVVVVSLLACAWPAMRALRVTVARALAYE
jgi:putative ABC transport system permease protein